MSQQAPQTTRAPSAQAEFEAALPAPVRRLHKFGQLANQVGARAFESGVASAFVLPLKLDGNTFQELFSMQAAILGRLQEQQRGWLAGLADIGAEYEQLHQAKTLSKYVLQEYNVMAQFGALAAAQASAFMELVENVQVNYAYWVDKKIGDDGDGAAQDATEAAIEAAVTPLARARKRA